MTGEGSTVAPVPRSYTLGVTAERESADLASLAESILSIAHWLRPRGGEWRDVVELTGTEVAVIREAIRSPGCTPTHIASITGLRRSNVSTAIRVLESRGLLVRARPDRDARSVQLEATEAAVESFTHMRRLWVERLLELPEDVRAGGLGALEAMERIAEELRDPVLRRI